MKQHQRLSIPHADYVAGKLYLPTETAELTDSMLVVKVGDYGIDVSWFPDLDPTGDYYVNVYRGEWENTVKTFRSADPFEVAAFLEEWVRLLSGHILQTSAAEDLTDPEPVIQAWNLSAAIELTAA